MLQLLDRFFNRTAAVAGFIACVAMVLLIFNVFYDVVMRYVFNDVSIGMQELEWHLFTLVFLFGTSYAMSLDGHVRVDLLYSAWGNTAKAWINLVGTIVLVWPFCVLVIFYGSDFTYQSYDMSEGSGDPGGLPYRWLIKSMIPVSFVFIFLASCGMATKAIKVLLKQDVYDASTSKESLS